MNAPVTAAKLYDCRDAFAETLEALAAGNDRVVAVCNDSVGSSKLGGFKSKFPERLVNVGIAEQNMVGVGAGLANGGQLPFVCGASCFLTGRALEQIKADLAYSNANVKLIGISSGMAYGELGPTHHSIEDFAWTRVLPNLPVIAPATASKRPPPSNGRRTMPAPASCACHASACRICCRKAMSSNSAAPTCCAKVPT